MNYAETLEFLYNQLPMYHRIGGAAYKADLHNTVALCKLLENPQNSFKTIHVAGTNGKGSTSHLLASILQEAGFKTGLYTSPHYKDFRERIKINGKMIPEEAVIRFIEDWKEDFQKIGLSFFEMTVGLAFDYFRNEKVDIAAIEVGLGGRLDSTNIIHPGVSVITNIGMDHTQFLGDTLQKIAFEKAGIIKPGTPVVIGETQEETRQVFEETAKSKNAPITFADEHFQVHAGNFNSGGFKNLEIFHHGIKFLEIPKFPLDGTYQLKNIVTVVQTIQILRNQGYEITDKTLVCGIENVFKNTGLQGRWQVLMHDPLAICDSGHNVDGIREVVENLKMLKSKKIHFVLGMVNDKDITGILKLLPEEAVYYFCKADIPRGLDAAVLAAAALATGLRGNVFSSVKEAYDSALLACGKGEVVFVGGSIFVVAEVL
jgi:dihydrofolate synthase/folylpolyglutamate synthase